MFKFYHASCILKLIYCIACILKLIYCIVSVRLNSCLNSCEELNGLHSLDIWFSQHSSLPVNHLNNFRLINKTWKINLFVINLGMPLEFEVVCICLNLKGWKEKKSSEWPGEERLADGTSTLHAYWKFER